MPSQPSTTDCEADISVSSPTSPLPELLMVAKKLKGKVKKVSESVREEVITPTVVIVDVTLQQSMIQEESPEVAKRTTTFYINSDYAPDDTFSASSFGSDPDQDAPNENIQTIAQEMENVSNYKFVEPETPGRAVSSMFIVMFALLGLTILTMIILTVVFNYGMLLMLVMIIIIFILIVILTNCCAMMYTI